RPGNRNHNSGGGPPYDDGPADVSLDDDSEPPYSPPAPYGNAVPTIDCKLKINSLPEWDGNPDTTIDYFWEVGQMAALEGWMPKALGFWLPSRLKKGSSVQLWFSTLASAKQVEMRKHYLTYLQTIRERFLGRKWQLLMNLKFEQQAFRQEGHKKESPQLFVNRMIRSIRMLVNSDDGGPMEVFLIMKKAPIRWSTILVIENIKSSEELYDKVNEHNEALIEALCADFSNAVTSQNLVATLRRLGVNMDPSRSHNAFRQANLTSATDADEPVGRSDQVDPKDSAPLESDSNEANEQESIRSVYNTFKKRQRPPPKGGYKYPKNDHISEAVALPSKSTLGMAKLKKSAFTVRMEEVEDKYWVNDTRMPKVRTYPLETEEDWLRQLEEEETEWGTRAEERLESMKPEEEERTERIRVRKRHIARPGDSALGVSVLSVKGWVDSLEEEPVDLWLDSGADITLVSEEFHASMKNPPQIREGHKMSLAQLMDSGTAIKGYVNLGILMETVSGDVAELEAEAYVVKGMSVPVLLGEDFQLTYQIGVECNVESGTKILFEDSEIEVSATGVEAPSDKEALYTLMTNLTVHSDHTTWAKEHRRRKRLRREASGSKIVRAAADYRIKPHHCTMVQLEGEFVEDCEWLVEQGLLADPQDSFLSIPNTLITTRHPFLAVSNTSDQPRMIRKGEILGNLVPPEKYFDTPATE
ncbi:hypothetical protein B0H17DRAFT_840960, partial [Mycena rosella]